MKDVEMVSKIVIFLYLHYQGILVMMENVP